MSTVFETLRLWNKNTSERTQLQHVYLVGSVALLVIAGLISLINVELGHQLLMAASLAFLLFVVNAVIWALLQSFVLLNLEEATPVKRKK